MNTTYTIQMASKLSGVGVHTIRAWEKRYRALEPTRDTSGHRVYTKSDVEKLMLLSELCLLGYTISKVAKLSIQELKDLLKDLGKSSESLDKVEFNLVSEKTNVEARSSLAILQLALANYKLDVIGQELQKIKSNVQIKELIFDLLIPLLNDAKDYHLKGQLSQLHLQTFYELVRNHLMFQLHRQAERSDKLQINCLVIGLDASNDLSLLLSGVLANALGLTVNYYGVKSSAEAVIEIIQFNIPSLLIIESPIATIEKLNHKFPNTEIVVLGKSTSEMERLNLKKVRFISSIQNLEDFIIKKVI